MAKISNFETQVVEFYGVSQDGQFIVGKPKEELLATVKFNNESDYNFFKKCAKGYLNGIVYGINVVKANSVPTYKIFNCNKFVKTVHNRVAV